MLFLFIFTLSAAPALAGVSGLEDAADLSVACSKGAKATVETLPGKLGKVCIGRSVACDVKEKGVLLFHANIDVACKLDNNDCPPIETCATRKLEGPIADAVRLQFDPNNATRSDGAGLGGAVGGGESGGVNSSGANGRSPNSIRVRQ